MDYIFEIFEPYRFYAKGHTTLNINLLAEGSIALAEDENWRRFPEFEKILERGQSGVTFARIEHTCSKLGHVINNGSDEEKARAQAVMTAYDRTLLLIQQLAELRIASRDK